MRTGKSFITVFVYYFSLIIQVNNSLLSLYTGHYNPQALPSVGTVEFMQSMMCDIRTECRAEDEVPKSDELPFYGSRYTISIMLIINPFDSKHS